MPVKDHPRLLIELHYLPCVAYFAYFKHHGKVLLDVASKFKKQTYRNRCVIRAANKIQSLTVPVRKVGSGELFEIEIDHSQKWLNHHLRSMQSAYGKAPFYEYYSDELYSIFSLKYERLIDLNLALLTKCLEFLDMKTDIEIIREPSIFGNYHITDARDEIHPKKALPDKNLFNPEKYFQVFGKNFVENLSIIDLIFCEGPEAKRVIEKSALRIDKFDK